MNELTLGDTLPNGYEVVGVTPRGCHVYHMRNRKLGGGDVWMVEGSPQLIAFMQPPVPLTDALDHFARAIGEIRTYGEKLTAVDNQPAANRYIGRRILAILAAMDV